VRTPTLSANTKPGRFLPWLAIFSKAWEIHPVLKIEEMERSIGQLSLTVEGLDWSLAMPRQLRILQFHHLTEFTVSGD